MTSVTSGAILSAALRSNVLALQNTQSLLDQTQLRLATGLKVNFAIDNPQNFFEARALSSRASSLSGLLDGIGQSISTLKAASNSVTALQSLTQQAQAVVTQAQTALTTNIQEARIDGDKNLANINNLPSNISGIDNNDRLIFSFVDTNGTVNTGNTILISTGDSINQLITNVNNIQDISGAQVFEASLNSTGEFQIRELNGNRFAIEFQDNASNGDPVLAAALGFGSLATNETTNGNAVTRVTVSATASLTTIRLFAQNGGSGGTAATASTTLVNLTNSATGLSGDIFNGESADKISISINGGTAVQVSADIISDMLQTVIDNINNATALNTKIKASFDAGRGELNIRAIDSTVTSIQFEILENSGAGGPNTRLDLQKLGFGVQNLLAADGSGNRSSESIELGSAAGNLATLETEFNIILTQVDQLITDAVFSGTNLLNGDTLRTDFNETRTSSLTTKGQALTSTSLGISKANFGRSTTVSNSLNELSTAASTVQNFSSALSNDLSIIQTRETFTNDTINNLQEGADKLTVADQNEEGAKLLALQTRQSLSVTALALGSIAQQSTLRLF